ncbi:MFS transporter [Streptomyces sp. NRRL B-3648]|uniref:MFS transporter n=1 Tax=Streptomyces sp. NRRL B-3648 TaxID=1519493 RepID=UPI00099C6FE1|nr:MFS transporter [Streptomyces sp. NRRL B-3648]
MDRLWQGDTGPPIGSSPDWPGPLPGRKLLGERSDEGGLRHVRHTWPPDEGGLRHVRRTRPPARRARFRGRSRPGERDFRRLWAGDAVSQLGSQITLFALPYTAVSVLHAPGDQLGLLQALYTLPFLLVPLPAGLWLDHRPLRGVLITVNIVCALLVLSVPLAAAAGTLRLAQLHLVAALGGAATVTSEIAMFALLPKLVTAERLASANSRLNAGLAVAVTSGPGIAVWLTTRFGAPDALLADCLTYLFCAAALGRITHRQRSRPIPRPGGRLRGELTAGLRVVLGYPPLRRIAVHAALFNACAQAVNVALVVHLVRDQRLGGLYGLVLVGGGLGGTAGTLLAPQLIRRLGHGRAALTAAAVAAPAFWLVPAAAGSRATVVALCSAGLFAGSAGAGALSVVSTTVRHLASPPALHARVSAAFRLVTFALVPVGALTGGLLVDGVGARATLWAAPAVMVAALLPLLTLPVRTLHHVERQDHRAEPGLVAPG